MSASELEKLALGEPWRAGDPPIQLVFQAKLDGAPTLLPGAGGRPWRNL